MQKKPMNRAEAFEPHRDRLFAIAYRMVGSVAEAEDLVQETFVRWAEADAEKVRSSEAYLTRILTRLCIDHLRSARVRREAYVGEWLPEPLVTDAGPARRAELADSLSMAFLRLLETLSPPERAVFLLREVFGYDYAEIAEVVDKTEANCRQLAHRARERIADGRPRFEASEQKRNRLLHSFLEAVEEGDLDTLQEILAEDVVLYTDGGGKAKAAIRPIYGADRVSRFFLSVRRKVPAGLQSRPAEVNGEPGLLLYVEGKPRGAWSFHVEGGRIQNIFGVANPDKLHALRRHPS